jgi:hypothetical protein
MNEKFKDEFLSIQIADLFPPKSSFYIDSAHPSTLAILFFIFVSFVLMHFFCAARAPPLLTRKDDLFPLNKSQIKVNASVVVDLTITDLHADHRVIDIRGSAALPEPAADGTAFNLRVATQVIFSRNFTVVNSILPKNCFHALSFPARAAQSTAFPILNRKISNYDTVEIRTELAGDFRGFLGFRFQSAFSDQIAWEYEKNATRLMSLLTFYMTGIFIWYFQSDFEQFTELCTIGLAAAGVLASTPFAGFFSRYSEQPTLPCIVMAIYIGAFRLFSVLQLEMISRRMVVPAMPTFWLLTVFFLVYVAFDAMGSYESTVLVADARIDFSAAMPWNWPLMICTAVYTVLVAAFSFLAVTRSKGDSPRRLFFFAFCLVGDAVACWAGLVAWRASEVFACSVFSWAVRTVLPMTAGAFAVFFLHTNRVQMYERLERADAERDFAVESSESGS